MRVAPRAARQIREAAAWWVSNRTAVPALLADEIEAAYTLLLDMPFAGEPVKHSRIDDLRRVLLGRTQYHLYYVVSEDGRLVEIVSLWHTHRGRKPRLS